MGSQIDIAKGRMKEAAGVLTGNENLQRKGRTDQAIGKVRQAAEKASDKIAEKMRK